MESTSANYKRKLEDDETTLTVQKKLLHRKLSLKPDAVCTRCTSILHNIKSFPGKGTEKGIKLYEFDSSDEWLVDTCDLCNVLSIIHPNRESSIRYDLMVFPISVLFPKFPVGSNARNYLERQPKQVFGIVPEGYSPAPTTKMEQATYLTLISPDINQKEAYVRLVPERVDYDILKTYISYCKVNHQVCRSHGPLVCKRVIDCLRRQIIITPQKCEYVALSYVWGSPRSDGGDWNPPQLEHQESIPLPNDLPTVISGAIDVTLELKQRYLWIDKCCIDKANSQEEKSQIDAMNRIYGRAVFTICVAFGEHHNSGISRVNTAIRKPQSSAIIQGMHFATTLTHPLSKVMQSTWSTRGWTHQEAVLSPRKLIFTEDETYFVCRGMECRESIHVLPGYLHKKRGDRYAGPNMPFQPYSYRERSRFSDFIGHMKEYTSRRLSRHIDSLRAFAGILSEFETCSPPIYNLFGLPIVTNMVVICFAHALTWIHDRLDNPDPIPIARRHDFPSYSFVGWRGTVSIHTQGKQSEISIKKLQVPGVDIKIRSVDNELYNLEYIKKLTAKGISETSLKLWIKAPVLPPDIWSKITKEDIPADNLKNPFHFEVLMHMSTGSIECRAEVSGRIKVDDFLEGIKSGALNCLLLACVDLSLPGKPQIYHHSAMIVSHNNEKTERVGILSFTMSGGDLREQVLQLAKEQRVFEFNSSG